MTAAALAVPGGWPALYQANRKQIGPDPDAVRAGTVLTLDGFQVATKLEDATLKQIAQTTDAEYYAGSASLDRISQVPLSLTVRSERTDVTGLFALAAGLLLVLGATLSLAWYGRVI